MMHRQLKDISIIIPCLNEAACIETLYKELSQVLASYSYPYELLFVDDGSTDNTLEVLSIITQADNRVHWISLSRNFGHQKALKAGIDAAKGQIVITMDADMQHPPTVIPRMLELWQEGYDIINTVRMENHKCSPFKKLTSQWFYRLMNVWSEVHIVKGGADFRLLDDKVIRVLRECREESLFLRGMTAWVGFRQIQIPYEANVRYAGETKYSLKKMFSFALCGITSFSVRPLRWAVGLAGFFALLSVAEILYAAYIACFTEQAVSGWASLAILISALGATILLMLGIIGEYLGKLFMQCKQRPEYIIKEKYMKE
ncbi:glycosyltransferase family 2 protein [Phocaeicola sartorii JCM 17136 = DSM 21941]